MTGPPAPAMARTVLVTGAAKGIGAACVLRLAHAGWTVYAGVRAEADGVALRRAMGDAVRPVLLDITDDAAITETARRIDEETAERGLGALVNNAGIAVAGPLEFLPLEELRTQLEINVTAQFAVTQACLPLLRRARSARRHHADGRIVFMSSVAGRSALPFIGAYGASKYALEAAADALRVELLPWGMRVVLIEPGVVSTPIWDTSVERARRSLARLPPQALRHYGDMLGRMAGLTTSAMGGLPAERVADVVLRALTARRPRARYVIGAAARSRILLEALLPTALRDWIVHQVARRLQGPRRHDP